MPSQETGDLMSCALAKETARGHSEICVPGRHHIAFKPFLHYINIDTPWNAHK